VSRSRLSSSMRDWRSCDAEPSHSARSKGLKVLLTGAPVATQAHRCHRALMAPRTPSPPTAAAAQPAPSPAVTPALGLATPANNSAAATPHTLVVELAGLDLSSCEDGPVPRCYSLRHACPVGWSELDSPSRGGEPVPLRALSGQSPTCAS
jgi:hypothetical protein